MMKSILFVFVFLIPSIAYSAEVYDVSCRNVAKIRIVRVDTTYWDIESDSGFFHVLALELKKDAAKEFMAFRDAAPEKHVRHNGEDYSQRDIIITANGKPLRNDDSFWTGFADQGINITIIREENAFKAARAVCPDLVPDKVLIDGYWE